MERGSQARFFGVSPALAFANGKVRTPQFTTLLSLVDSLSLHDEALIRSNRPEGRKVATCAR